MTGYSPTSRMWRKSSHSSDNQACVEVAGGPGATAVRDSKRPTTPHLGFEATAWTDFVERLRVSKANHRI